MGTKNMFFFLYYISCIWKNNILRYKTVRPVPNSRNRSTINDHRSKVSFVYFCSFLGETIDHLSDHRSDHRSPIVDCLVFDATRRSYDHRSPITDHRSIITDRQSTYLVRRLSCDHRLLIKKTPIADRSNRQSTYLVRRLSCDLDYRSPIKKTD